MQVLVTGGAGFIGSNLTLELVRRGHTVRILDDFTTGFRHNLGPVRDDAEILTGDVRDPDAVNRAAAGCEVVFHQAALPSVPRSLQDPVASHEVNATGTLNVLLAARNAGARGVVVASSSSVYGDVAVSPKVETLPTAPISPYGVSKLAAERYAYAFTRSFGLATIALRYFNVFGPRQDPESEYAAVIPRFIGAFVAGRAPVIHGDGEQSRDFTFVDDVVSANLAAADALGTAEGVFNVARGDSTTLNQLAAELRRLTSSDVEPVHGPSRPGDIRASRADVTRARDLLGWTAAVTVAEGLARTVAAFPRASLEVQR